MDNMDFSVFQDLIKKSKMEEGVYARFYDRAIKTGNVKDNGLPEFKNTVYIEIRIKDNNDVVDRKATDDDKKRFPIEWERFNMKKTQTEKGTPLNQFAFLDVSQIESCEYRGIFTVEALAELSEDNAREIGLVDELGLAKRFLEVSKNNKTISDYQGKEKELKEEIKKLKKEIARLKSAGAKDE